MYNMRKEIVYDIMNSFIDLEKITEPLAIEKQNQFCNGRLTIKQCSILSEINSIM
ncbi:MAG: hypothetical protein HFG28_03170 [Eubacterium sp.]|nr:hypothetical protein [Eubacterium sp.]